MEARFYYVKSFTDPNKIYTVRHVDFGDWRCSCPYFVFNRKKCDHIRRKQKVKMKYHGRK